MIICIVPGFIDLSDGKGRILQLRHTEKFSLNLSLHPMGFLPNVDLMDLMIVSINRKLKDNKIYLYSFTNKPATNATFWECSQIYDIEIPESSKSNFDHYSVYQTKLFLFYERRFMTQIDLLTVTFDTQYFFDEECYNYPVLNKDQTLLTLNFNWHLIIFSMKTGIRISNYSYG